MPVFIGYFALVAMVTDAVKEYCRRIAIEFCDHLNILESKSELNINVVDKILRIP